MIDWDKVVPQTSPAPGTGTTAPVAPAQPGSLVPVVPNFAGTPATAPYEWGTGFHEASQEQIDAMDPGQRLARGMDNLGNTLFGRGNGSPLGGVPLLGDIIGAGGNIVHDFTATTVIKPVEAGAAALARIPLGWLPGGADDTFNQFGEWAKANNPTVYEEWQRVNAVANADVLAGGNMKADWNMEFARYLDDQQKDSFLGTTPDIAMGRAGIGSAGGALSHAITGFLGLLANTSQRALGGAGIFDPGYSSATYEQQKERYFNGGGSEALGVGDEQQFIFQQLADGKITEEEARAQVEKISKGGRSRLEEAGARYDMGLEISDIEKKAVEAMRSGAWSSDHAQDYIVSHGQGVTRNLAGQIAGSVVTDPLLYATVGAGAIAKAGRVGVAVSESGLPATTAYERAGVLIGRVQQGPLGPAFRIGRGLVDPLAVYKPSTVAKATTDILHATALDAYGRTYGRSVYVIRGLGREFGKGPEVDSAIMSYARDQADLMVSIRAQGEYLEQGIGEELLKSSPDDIADTLAANAGRDASTELTDHMTLVAKNTFTAEEEATLAGRAAVFFGRDIPYWEARLAKMSFRDRSALHTVTYKDAEAGFQRALAQVDSTAYKGDAPMRNAVLMTPDTLDDQVAKNVIEDIRDILKQDRETNDVIAMGTAHWNAQATRYPTMATIGYAPGGEAQLNRLVDELERMLNTGGITRRMLDDELGDPALAPVRDFLDRNSMPGPTIEPYAPAENLSPQPLMDEFGWPLAKAQELVDNSEMVPVNQLKPLREIDQRAAGAPLDDLKESIAANGGINSPIIVWWDPTTGGIVVADGNHRLTIAIEEGWESVPVVVEVQPTNILAQAENVATMAKLKPKPGTPNAGVLKPSQVFPGARITPGTASVVPPRPMAGAAPAPAAAAAAPPPAAAAAPAAGAAPLKMLDVVHALTEIGAGDAEVMRKVTAAGKLGTIPDMVKWLDDVYGIKDQASAKAFLIAHPEVIDRLNGIPGSVKRVFDPTPLPGVPTHIPPAPGRVAEALGREAPAAPKEPFQGFISVKTGALPIGHGKVFMGDAKQAGGAPVRGIDVISPSDPMIPDTVYHVTTNYDAVQSSGVLKAGGQGGLGGDDADQIVSLTIDRDVAEQLTQDMRLVATAYQSPAPYAVFTQAAIDEGWSAKWLSSNLFLPDGTPSSVADKYSVSDWQNIYFNMRPGKRNPIIFGDSLKNVDPNQIGIVTVPKKSLRTGALLTNFDIDGRASGLQEIRSYGDVPLTPNAPHQPTVAVVPDVPVGKPMVQGDLDKVANAMGMPDARATEVANPEYVFRAISDEDYQNILSQGYMKSDGRMNLSVEEGTVAADNNPSWYLPGQLRSDAPGVYRGRIVKIKRTDLWHKDKVDGYWKTNEEVPATDIEMVSPVLRRDTWIGPRERTFEQYMADMAPISEEDARVLVGDHIEMRDGVEWVVQGRNNPIRQDNLYIEEPPRTRAQEAAAQAKYKQEVADYDAAKAEHDAAVKQFEDDTVAFDAEDNADIEALRQHEYAMDQYRKDLATYEADQQAYDDLVREAEEEMADEATPDRILKVTNKWRDAKKEPTRLRAELERLADEGYDVDQADSLLDDYTNIERDGMSMEDFGAEKQDAWDQIMDELDAVRPLEKELPDEPIPPTEPVRPTTRSWEERDARQATRPQPPVPFGKTKPAPPLAYERAAPPPPPPPKPPADFEIPDFGNKPNRMWRVGFRPDEADAWGLKRSAIDGRPVVDRAPTISHVTDAVPGRQPFSDTTRNALGQIIGRSGAERLNKPIESIEAMLNTLQDGITGRRLVMNMEQRFERSTFDIGIPAPISKQIWEKARDVAGLEYTTVRGIKPQNLWKEIHDFIPRDLVLTSGKYKGKHLNIHIVMDHLLAASEGDLRIMGVTSNLSQRARNGLRKMGDGSNVSGQMTITAYNKLRYALNPMFLIQRVGDAVYYSILYGVTPVGKGLNAVNKQTRTVTDNLGLTGMARHFSMDMPEYATRSNFTAGIKSLMQEQGLLEHRLDQIVRAPDDLMAANMTNMLSARWGDIVRGALDNLATAAERGDPALKADLLAAGDTLNRSFADWRRIYSDAAGYVLDDNEVGLRYVQDMLTASRRITHNADGTMDFEKLIHEGEMFSPDDIGAINSIRPDALAQRLGYQDATTLRRDVMGHTEKIKGEFVLVQGEHDIKWLESALRHTEGAHPDYTRRALAYFSETWSDFWGRLARPVADGGLDISPHYAKEAQDLIAIWARERGMDPWEYLSGVMASNIGPKDLQTHMGQLLAFLKTGKSKQPIEEWAKMFRATLDVSAQKRLIQEFEAAVNVEDVLGGPAPALWRLDAAGKPMLPASYLTEPGYVYRIQTMADARQGWLPMTRVGKEANVGDITLAKGEGIFRAKEASVGITTKNATAKHRLVKTPTPPDQIEMLDRNGNWVTLGPDPMDTIMAVEFPEVVRQRLISGVPHPDPEIEAYIQQFSKWVSESLDPQLSTSTRADLRRLVESVPTTDAASFNRSQALVVSLLKDKIRDASQDVFRLAEMQTKRTVIERSINHPLFGLYPASYMWGKVLPETVKFLAKNPYAATYTIAEVQRAIAIQREYDTEMDEKVGSVDRSAGAFLLDYLTPGLPWSSHEARMSPLFRGIFNGKDVGQLWQEEIDTASPQRWVKQLINALNEIPGAADEITAPPESLNEGPSLEDLGSLTGSGAIPAPEPGGAQQITGPTKASALGPILADDLTRLQQVILGGQAVEE